MTGSGIFGKKTCFYHTRNTAGCLSWDATDLLAEDFQFGVPTGGRYASIGTIGDLVPSIHAADIRLFWHRLLCITSPDEVLDTYYYAAMGDGYGEDGGNIPLLNCRINSAEIGWRQWLAPDPCNQCHKPVIYIREVRYADGVISWKLADHEKVKEIIVSGYDSGEYATIVTVPCVADTGSVRIGREHGLT